MQNPSYKKNNETPTTLIIAPSISIRVTFFLNMKTWGISITSGVVAMIVATTPVLADWTAKSDSETPMNGPKIDPNIVYFNPLKSLFDSLTK